MSNEIEIWKDVVGYDGLYQVSSLGNVKVLNFRRTGKERNLLKPISGKYITIGLSLNKVRKTHYVHVMVAMAFHGHIPDGMNVVVDHIDNNPFNNHVDNLRLTTSRDNCTKDLKGGSSKYIGVSWHKQKNKWVVHITFKKRHIHLGLFDEEIDAKKAYDKAFEEWEKGLDLNIIYPKRIKTSQYKGVYWNKKMQKWKATYKGKYIGCYNTELEAYEAVQNYIKNLQAISEAVI